MSPGSIHSVQLLLEYRGGVSAVVVLVVDDDDDVFMF